MYLLRHQARALEYNAAALQQHEKETRKQTQPSEALASLFAKAG
jgi:hypothetical protein